MKLTSLIASMCMLCLGYSASAQMYGGSSSNVGSTTQGVITTGVRVGLTFSSIKMSDGSISIESDNLTGFQIGAISNYAISENFSLQAELLLIQKGGSYGESGQAMDIRSNYLEIPVLAKASIGTGTLTGFVTAGPTLGYWMSGTFADGSETYEIDFEDGGANRFEAGLSLGAGAAYNNFTLDVRYGLGLTNIFVEEDVTSTNRGVGVSLGYMFDR